MKEKIKAAIRAELERQSEGSGAYIYESTENFIGVDGLVDLDDLAQAVSDALFGPRSENGFWITPDGVKFTLESMARDYCNRYFP